jgi:hypothetical protein
MRAIMAFMHAHGHLVNRVQHTVDAKADHALLAPRLQVDVAGALVKRVLPQPVHHLHHALVVGVQLLVGLAQLHQLLEAGRAGIAAAFWAARTDLASAKNSAVYRWMSCGLATTRRTPRRDWRSTSATQSVRKGSAVATTTSLEVT